MSRFLPLTVVAMLALCGPAFAGELRGRVADEDGFGLPGATVAVRGPLERAVLSGTNGLYRIAGIEPGAYTVSAKMPGYAPVERSIEVSADATVEVDFILVAAFEQTVVVSASRSQVALEDAPTTITVIDETTIDTAPAQNLGDLLRTVPGVNVVQGSARDINVASRQASPFLTGSQLAMVDGRPIYFDFFSIIMWDLISVSTTDVKQIEVVRGPASAMWGANAATGVVNLVTKDPRDSQGLELTLSGGAFERAAEAGGTGGTGSFNVRWADAVDDRLAYRISAGYTISDPFERPTGLIPLADTPIEPVVTVGGGSFDDAAYANVGTKQPKVDLRLDQELEGEGRLVYSAGYAGTAGIFHSPIGPFDLDEDTWLGYGQVAYTRGGLKASVFANYLRAHGRNLISIDENEEPLTLDFTNGICDLDLGYRDLLGNRHLVSFGGNIRYNSFDLSTLAPGADHHRQAGAYIQDEIDLDSFRLALALRADDFSNLDEVIVSPRAAVIWSPAPGHSLKLSYNRAFRAPSAIENHIDVSLVGGYFPVREFDPRLEEDFPIVVDSIGNTELEAEIIDAVELSYSAFLNNGRTFVETNLYVSETDNLISLNPSPEALIEDGVEPFYTSDNPPEGWPLHPITLEILALAGVRLPSTIKILNLGAVRNRGVEVGVTHRFKSGWSLTGNYSYQDLPELLDPVGDPDRPPSDTINVPPESRFNLGLAYNGPEYLGSLTVSYSDRAFFSQGINPFYYGWAEAYTLVGLSVGKRWNDGRVTTAVKAHNVLDEHAQQHVFGDILRRTVVLETRFQF